MKRFVSAILILALLCAMGGCFGEKPVAPPTEAEVMQALLAHAEPQLQAVREKWNLPDLALDIQFETFEVEPASRSSGGFVSCILRDRLYCPGLEEMIRQKTLPTELLWEISGFAVDYRGAFWNGYELICDSAFAYPVLMSESGAEYTLAEDMVLQGDTVVFVAGEEHYANGQTPDKPYVGMDVSMIDKTGLGEHDKTGYNEKKDADGRKHRCTLYYWMEEGRCIFIARVQDDIGRVILVEENPAGSYFGN